MKSRPKGPGPGTAGTGHRQPVASMTVIVLPSPSRAIQTPTALSWHRKCHLSHLCWSLQSGTASQVSRWKKWSGTSTVLIFCVGFRTITRFLLKLWAAPLTDPS